MVILLVLLFLSIKKARENERLLYEVEFYIDSLNRYTKIYNSESFSKLKKENKELYNQLRKTDSLYTFKEETDTVGYDLQVWATHLAKYKINFNITNKFLLTNQRIGDSNRMEITSQLPGKIGDVTMWTKPEKKKRFGLGLSVGAGYGVFNKDFDVFVGLSGTYLIW